MAHALDRAVPSRGMVGGCSFESDVLDVPITNELPPTRKCGRFECLHAAETVLHVHGPISPDDPRTACIQVACCACPECATAAVESVRKILGVGYSDPAARRERARRGECPRVLE